jgi:hypothetical protein
MAELISFGAGLNSTALAIMLIKQGWQGHIVFADTGCEWPDTYCFIDYFESQWLNPRGFAIERIRQQHKAGGKSLIEYCESALVIPLAAMRWCTAEWKVEALLRYAPNTTMLLRISAEESHRQVERPRPLVDAGIDREGCRQIIQAEGLPIPHKSSCYICPFQQDSQWRELWQRHPDLFDRAMRLEEAVQGKRVSAKKCTLDPSGEIYLRQRKLRYEAQLPLLDDAIMEGLLAYKPCVCGL